MKKLHLIMPMGGKGQRFFDNGFVIPKPLIEIKGKPFFYWSAMSLMRYIPDIDITFVVLKEHIHDFDIKNTVLKYFPSAAVAELDHVLNGAVLTCMEGAKLINDDLPLIFNDCDHMFRSTAFENMTDEQQDKLDGALLTFRSDSPKFSYAKCSPDGIVEKTVEKQVISNNAICGAYYFKNKNTFTDNANAYLKKCSYTEYFMSGVYDKMAESGLLSGIFETDYHISFGTPEEYSEAEKRSEFDALEQSTSKRS